MDKDIYANDLLHRFPGYSFTETVIGDLVTVAFLNVQEVELAAARTELTVDAYRTIRRDVLGGEIPVFLSSTSERNLLSNLSKGVVIFNTNKQRIEAFDGSDWLSSSGPGMMTDVAYGEMWQDDSAGTTIPQTGVWTGASPGLRDENEIISISSSQLIVGEDGTGDYAVSFNANFTSDAGSNCTAHLRINGFDTTKIKDEHPGDSSELGDLSASGIMKLIEDDYLELHFESEDSGDTIKVYQVNLNIRRIS